jgi:hypothetical protein
LRYAYRSFLYCTYPHTSNALVDVHGYLWLIDFAKTYLSTYELEYAENEDIERLHSMVSECEQVMDACLQVSTITPEKIIEAFSCIPDHFWRDTKATEKKYMQPLKWGHSIRRKRQRIILLIGWGVGAAVSTRRMLRRTAKDFRGG